jgi:predicted DNA-binding transcriptional regulator AlpA
VGEVLARWRAAGTSKAAFCRAEGIASVTLSRWLAEFGGHQRPGPLTPSSPGDWFAAKRIQAVVERPDVASASVRCSLGNLGGAVPTHEPLAPREPDVPALSSLLFVDDLADLLGLSRTAVRRLIRRGDLGPHGRLGRRLYVWEAAAVKHLERMAGPAEERGAAGRTTSAQRRLRGMLGM